MSAEAHRHADADAHLTRCLAICSRSLGDAHPETLRVMHRLAMLHLETNPAVAETEFKQVLNARKAVYSEKDPRLAQSYKALLNCCQVQKKYAEALEYGEKAVEVLKGHYGTLDCPEVVGCLKRMDELRRIIGK
eukprot:TRINITY_DN1502_c0_g1_i2.p1 TRINITY_DN1502_c0_g1~~TRINITY_DN1502_c0_g1_i2.p1  ORF type:complete len:134 (+),score=31.83 TRINITY_DN1502_c0_g1_i2:557-958(+)